MDSALILSAIGTQALSLLLGVLMLILLLPRDHAQANHSALWWGLAIFLGQVDMTGLLWLSASLNGGFLHASGVGRTLSIAVLLLVLANAKKIWGLKTINYLPQWSKPTFSLSNGVIAGLSILLITHVVLLWHEVLLRPSYGADTLSLLGLRAKHMHLGMNINDPFIVGENYPLFVSLLRYWPNAWQTEFREILPNLSWGIAYIGILLTLYGGLRQLRLSPLLALVATYALASIPLVGIHIALSGYVDFYVGYGILAALLCLCLAFTQKRFAWFVLFLLCVFAVAKMKRPTIYWGILLLASAWVGASSVLPRKRWWQISSGALALALLGLIFAGQKGVLYYQEHFNLKTFNVMPDMFFENLWVTSSYNLLWVFFVLILLYAWRSLSAAVLRPVGFFVLAGLLVTVLSVGLTSTNPYWAVQTVINRSLLHFVPSMVLLMALLWQEKTAIT